MRHVNLQEKYPDIQILKSATRLSDNTIFNIGDRVKLNKGNEVVILGFDHYNKPLPIKEDDEPINVMQMGNGSICEYLTKFHFMVRAIHDGKWSHLHTFTDLEEIQQISA